MLIKTRGIVFKSIKYSETSLIVDIYTEEKGLRKYLISGVRRKKASTSASLFQIMSLVDLVAYHRDDKDLTRIKEIKPDLVFQQIPFDLIKGAIGMFMIEVAQKTIRESEENPSLFNFLHHSFAYLDASANPIANVHLYFLLELSFYLGFVPTGEFQDHCPYFDLKEGIFIAAPPDHPYYMDELRSKQLSQLLQCSMENCHEVKLNRQERKGILNQLLDYYRLHIENFPSINAHQILEEVLEDS